MTDDQCLPAWSLLTASSVAALLKQQDGSMPAAVSIRSSLSSSAVTGVALVETTRLMIERAVTEGGLVLTATGALSRADTRAIFDAMTWLAFDKAQVLRMNKVLNEADVVPVEATRLIGQAAKLFRRRERRLHATTKAKQLVAGDQSVGLFRLVFETLFWKFNLGYLDRLPVEGWPQNHFGLVLWCLSIAAQEWTMPAPLVPVCTAYDDAFAAYPIDFPAFAFENRALRPLTWLGLFETRLVGDDVLPDWRKDRQYRKAPLFDEALAFDVEVIRPQGRAH